MKKVKYHVQLSGSFEVDVPNEATDEEIEKIVQESILEEIYCEWWEEE